MPVLTLPPLTRRAFALTAAGVALRGQTTPLRVALLSDTHIPADPAGEYRGFRPQANLAKIVPGIAAANVESALICGDLARLLGLPGDYAALRKLLAPVAAKMPVAFALGNHDDRKNFLAAAGPQAGAQPVQSRHVTVIETQPVNFVVLDSLIEPDLTPGLLGKAQRAWLAGWLQTSGPKPVVLFVHHPLDDADGSLLDAPRLFAILRLYPNVKAIVFGHTHKYAFDTTEGIHLINLPAVGYNFSDAEPVGWVESEFTPTGAAFTLRAAGGDTARDGQTVTLRWRA